MTEEPTPGPGHNNPPPYDAAALAALDERAAKIAAVASAWSRAEITDEAKAGELKDHIAAAKDLIKDVEAARKAAKQPHLDAGRSIDAAYGKVAATIKRAAEIASGPLKIWLQEQERLKAARQAEKEAEARAIREEAERKERLAEERADAQVMADADEARAEAERLEAEARRLAKSKASVESATGLGGNRVSLRRVRRAVLVDVNRAMLRYRERDEMRELLERLANADLRASKGKEIILPGFTIVTEEKI